MTDDVAVEGVDVPTFSDCVVGYRAWLLDDEGQLWPLRGQGRAWVPGVNTARCECGASDRLHFEWNWVDGKRVLEPAPLHDAPGETCACGLYSIRQPRQWSTDAGFADGRKVAGAVASWGRMQVHSTGVRAEHACVVALAHPHDASKMTRARIAQAAARYRVEDVDAEDLVRVALEHGHPLPDTLHDAAADPPVEFHEQTGHTAHAPDATIDDVPTATPTKPSGRRVRRHHVALLTITVVLGLIVALLVFDHRTTPCNLQIVRIGGGGTIEQCLSQTTTHANKAP